MPPPPEPDEKVAGWVEFPVWNPPNGFGLLASLLTYWLLLTAAACFDTSIPPKKVWFFGPPKIYFGIDPPAFGCERAGGGFDPV